MEEETIKNQSFYIKNISINNFATFKQQTITFSPGLNIIIGETGSGKSLILEALHIAFGNRAEKKSIRRGADFACVEVIIFCTDSKIKKHLEEIGFPFEDNEITIKRIISNTGISKNYLNFQLCPLSILSDFSREYIDLVGQFENQKLLTSTYQLSLIDNYINKSITKYKYDKIYNETVKIRHEFDRSVKLQDELKKKEDYLKYILDEISALNPSRADEEKLIEEKNRILTYEKRKNAYSECLQLLIANEENSAIYKIKKISKTLKKDELVNQVILGKIDNVINDLNDIAEIFNKELNREQSEEINFIIDRLDSYQKIKRKLKLEIDELINFQQSCLAELNEIENLEIITKQLSSELSNYIQKSMDIAQELHFERVQKSIELSKLLTKNIQNMNMEGAKLILQVDKSKNLDETGISIINIYAQTNEGEGLHLLKNIASGGELSRILLAIRHIFCSNNSVSVFLFDEVDTGLGGVTARKIGKQLKDVSEKAQVLAITHLPQMAIYADKLILVKKIFSEDISRTFSSVIEVPDSERKNAIEQMTGLSCDNLWQNIKAGEVNTPSSVGHFHQ